MRKHELHRRFRKPVRVQMRRHRDNKLGEDRDQRPVKIIATRAPWTSIRTHLSKTVNNSSHISLGVLAIVGVAPRDHVAVVCGVLQNITLSYSESWGGPVSPLFGSTPK